MFRPCDNRREMKIGDLLLVVVSYCLLAASYATIPADLNDRALTCEQAKRLFAHDISCEADGSYSPRQCSNRRFLDRCVCVNPNTGEWLNEYPSFREEDAFDCITSFPEERQDACPSLHRCRLVCQFGREVDDRECPTCSCVPRNNEEGNETKDEGGDEGSQEGPNETEEDLNYCNNTCPTVRMLSQNCRRECLVKKEDNKCPACNRTCMQTLSERNGNGVPGGENMCDDCAENQLCLRRGVFGQHVCFDRPSENEECSVLTVSEQAKKAASILASSRAAARAALATLQSAQIPCREGLACISVSLRKKICLPESEPDSSEACIVSVNGERIEFKHGTPVLNRTNCSRCLCVNGRLRFCEQAKENCTALSLHLTSRHSCTVENRGEIQHGENFRVDCNICGCRFGRLSCTHRQCDGANQIRIENKKARCLRCHFQPRNPVCGPNGRTYASYCHAVECVGLSAVTLLRGPCTDYDVCRLYPCGDGEVCVKRGGISCFGSQGCDLRLCVDPARLVCEGGEEEEDRCTRPDHRIEATKSDNRTKHICGTNGRSYPSICRLLQDTAFSGQVAHIGRCNAKECQGGPVCGTDGITYENVCLLRSQSGTGRVDYRGTCRSDEGSLENTCKRVRKDGMCRFSRDNCRRLVRPENGCCHICGGVVVTAIDSVGLSNYVQLNSEQDNTIDALLQQLIDFLKLTNPRCQLDGALTDSGNLELVFSPVSDSEDDAKSCNNWSMEIAMKINSAVVLGSEGGGDGDREPIPPLLQFMSAATTSPLIVENKEDGGQSDASTTVMSMMLVLLGCTLLSYII